MKKLVVFDLDGTLVDSIRDLAGAVNRMLAARGLPQHELPAYKLMVGEGFRKLVARALPEELRKPDYIEEARAEAAADYAERCLEFTRPYPGAAELLAALAARGVAAAVLSNKPDALTKKVVSGSFPAAAFALVRGELPEFPRKPDPASALDLCRRIGAAPGETLYLGDSGVDMKTAKAAGFAALGALWGFRGEAELRAAGAEALLERPLDLLEYL